MSWAAHDFETYVIQRHLGVRVSYLGVLVGTYAPDALVKWYVYGVDKGPVHIGAAHPALFHRGWPGAGFTHSIAFALLLGLVCWLFTRSRGWTLGLTVGALAHVVTDTSDTVGTMLFFPLSTDTVSIGLWAYAAEAGRYADAAAYYSSLGVVTDLIWLGVTLLGWRVFTADYFRRVIVPADGAWAWLGRRVPESALLALYRASLFYGTTRLAFWLMWTHVFNAYRWDISMGGPSWIEAVRF